MDTDDLTAGPGRHRGAGSGEELTREEAHPHWGPLGLLATALQASFSLSLGAKMTFDDKPEVPRGRACPWARNLHVSPSPWWMRAEQRGARKGSPPRHDAWGSLRNWLRSQRA